MSRDRYPPNRPYGRGRRSRARILCKPRKGGHRASACPDDRPMPPRDSPHACPVAGPPRVERGGIARRETGSKDRGTIAAPATIIKDGRIPYIRLFLNPEQKTGPRRTSPVPALGGAGPIGSPGDAKAVGGDPTSPGGPFARGRGRRAPRADAGAPSEATIMRDRRRLRIVAIAWRLGASVEGGPRFRTKRSLRIVAIVGAARRSLVLVGRSRARAPNKAKPRS
jgi:hypothetical protein